MNRNKKNIVWGSSIIIIALLVAGCTGNKTLDLVRGINDVSIAAINANALPPPNNLSDPLTAQVLTVNKQLLDIVQAKPADMKNQLTTVITNARQALPQPLDAKIAGWLTLIEGFIGDIK